MTVKNWWLIPTIIVLTVVVTVAIFFIASMPKVDSQASGASLYAQNCERCHGPLAASERRGRTTEQIQTAISNVNAMKGLSNLTPAQIQAIVEALATP